MSSHYIAGFFTCLDRDGSALLPVPSGESSCRALQNAIVQLNHKDCWCAYELKPEGNAARFQSHFAAFEAPGGPTAELIVEQEWLPIAFEDCASMVTPGGDGYYLEYWTQGSPIPSWAEEALFEAEGLLRTIESEHRPMTFDEQEDANIIS